MHLWKECPMLMICEYCNQVVEIAEINLHLLEECKEKNFFIECDRCKGSVLKDFYEDHYNSNMCKTLKIELGI